MIQYLLSFSAKKKKVRPNSVGCTLHLEFLETRCVMSGSPSVLLENWQSVIFDDGITGTLPFGFARDSETVDPQGENVLSNDPRFGEGRALTEVGTWTQVMADIGLGEMFGSGWDHDGQTPLGILWNANTRQLIFFRGYDFSIANTVSLDNTVDLLNGDVPGYRYVPQNAVIHDGLVVIMLQRDRRVGSTWVEEGISFAYTQDYGQTFQRVEQAGGGFDVPAIPGGVTDGMDRSRAWAFANVFPEKSKDDRLGAWFPWTDYIQKSNSTKGGQIGLFRARREAIGELWIVEPNVTVYETWRPNDSGGFHAHAAGMFVDGLASFWGDVSYRNTVMRHVADDLENYTTTTWTHQEDFQGGWSPTASPTHLLGNQALSAAPGPEFGEILVAADEQPEFIMKVERPEQFGEKAIITNLRGIYPGPRQGPGYAGRTASLLQYLPGVGYVAKEIRSQVEGTAGLYFSRDGQHWGTLQNMGSAPYYLFGEKIVVTQGGALHALDVPRNTEVLAPLLLNPGSTNLAGDEWTQVVAGQAGNSVRRVLYSDGIYVYQDTGEPLDIQPQGYPPVASDMPIYEFTSDGSNSLMGAWRLGNTASTTNQLHWLTAWHYSLDGDGISPRIRIGTVPNTESEFVWVANNEWVPTLHSGVPNPTSTSTGVQQIRIFNGSSPAPRRWLMGVQAFNQGAAPIYPAGPSQVVPNEQAHVQLTDVTDTWSTALTFGLPQLSSFSSYADPAGTGTVHTIASIYQSNFEHIDITFTNTSSAQGVIAVDVYSSNVLMDRLAFNSIYFDREDQIRMVISNSPEELGVTLLVTRNGYGTDSKSILRTGTSLIPTQIRLSNADRTVVEPMEWFAIQFSATDALSTEEREIMVRSHYMFTRLDAPPELGPPGFDDDNDIDGRDFLIWQRNYGAQFAKREQGDSNLDGVVDGVDLENWQKGYGLGFNVGPATGDFNQDGVVDGADLIVWQEGYGTFRTAGSLSSGDSNYDGNVNGRDFLVWQRQYTGSETEDLSDAASDGPSLELTEEVIADEAIAIAPIVDEALANLAKSESELPQLQVDSDVIVETGFALNSGLRLWRAPAGEPKSEKTEQFLVQEKIFLDATMSNQDDILGTPLAWRNVTDASVVSIDPRFGVHADDWMYSADLAIDSW